MSRHDEPLWIPPCVRRVQADPLAEEGFRRLYEHFAPILFTFFANRGQSHDGARDLTQEALMRVFKNIRNFRSESTFTFWVFTVARHVWNNDHRSRTAIKREVCEIPLEAPRGVDGREPDAFRIESPGLDPEQTALAADRRRQVGEAVDRLPPGMRKVALLRYAQGLSYQEVADTLGVALDTVKSQLFNAHQRLRPLLAPLAERRRT